MPEVDFLPAWYPQVRRRHFLLRAQLSASLVLLVSAALVLMFNQREAHATRTRAAELQDTLRQTRDEVRELDELLSLQEQLLAKQRVVEQLGLTVEATRVLADIDRVLPAGSSLDQFTLETVETPRQLGDIAAEKKRRKSASPPTLTRQTQVRIRGVAPAEAQVTQVFSALLAMRHLHEVRLESSAEMSESLNGGRSFDMSFVIPLDYAPEPAK
jgi:Tfp pilus assembly protein PilN